MRGEGAGHDKEVPGRRGVGGALYYPESLRRILLEAPPQQRTPDDLDALVDYTRTLHFFRNIPMEAAREVLSVAEFVRIPADRVVLLKNHPNTNKAQNEERGAGAAAEGSHYFVMLTGRTSVHAVDSRAAPPSAEAVLHNDFGDSLNSVTGGTLRALTPAPGGHPRAGGYGVGGSSDAAAHGPRVKFFGPGEGFGGEGSGDLGGLLPAGAGGGAGGGGEGGTRFSVLTVTDCEMLRLTRQQYDEVVSKAWAAEAKAKTALLQTLPPFDFDLSPAAGEEGDGDWPGARAAVAQLARAMEMHIVRRNARLVSEGEEGGGRLYFVRDGELRVTMRLGGGGGGEGGGGDGYAASLPTIHRNNAVNSNDNCSGKKRGGSGGSSGGFASGSGNRGGENVNGMSSAFSAKNAMSAASQGQRQRRPYKVTLDGRDVDLTAAGEGGRGGGGGVDQSSPQTWDGRSVSGGGGGGAGSVEVAVLGPGDMFGELAALSGCPQPYDVCGVTSTAKVYSISVDDLAAGVREKDERRVVDGLKKVVVAARRTVDRMKKMRDSHLRHEHPAAAKVRNKEGGGGKKGSKEGRERGGGGGGRHEHEHELEHGHGMATTVNADALTIVRPGGTPATRLRDQLPSVITNRSSLPTPPGTHRPAPQMSSGLGGLAGLGQGGSWSGSGSDPGLRVGTWAGAGQLTAGVGAVGARRRPTAAEVLGANAAAMTALMEEPPLHAAIRQQLARHEAKNHSPTRGGAGGHSAALPPLTAPSHSRVGSGRGPSPSPTTSTSATTTAAAMASNLGGPQHSTATATATTSRTKSSTPSSPRTRASVMFASNNLVAGKPSWNLPPDPSGRSVVRASRLDGRPAFALRQEPTQEERLRAVRGAREEEKKRRWAEEEEVKRKQKLGMYLPPLHEENEDGGGGGGGGGDLDSYVTTISPGQHKTAKTVERARRAGKLGAIEAPRQSFAGDVDDGMRPSLRGRDGSTRLVFHCYDQEIAAYHADSMSKDVFKYERQALRRRTKAKNTSFL